MSVTIGTKTNGRTAWLGAPGAACWQALEAQGMPADGITDAGRTTAEQALLWADYLAGRLKATAARPGSPEAHHEDQPPDGAHAVDLTGGTQAWMLAHHPACWSRPLLPRETWHWEHDRSRCTNQPHPGGFLMALTDQQQADVYQRLVNIEGVAAKLDADVLAPHAKLDTVLQWLADVRTGVGGLPALLAAITPGQPTDPQAVADELARELGPQVAAQVAAALQRATVTITPGH